jgi:hypothetical protein
MSYVILSRVTSIKQLYLVEFDQRKIYCSSVAKKQAQRLRERAINMKETEWDQQRDGVVRISSLNARSLQQHYQDLQKDKFIMTSDIIAVQETWFESDPKDPITEFHEYYVHGRSKGIALFTKNKPIITESLQTVHCSIIKASYSEFDLINIYRFSNDTNISLFTEVVLPLLDTSRTQVIVGDVNIDLLKIPQNPFMECLEQSGFQQIVTRPTHVLGGLIDHVYFYSPNRNASCTLHKYHTVFWSDHSCQSIILKTTPMCLHPTGNWKN